MNIVLIGKGRMLDKWRKLKMLQTWNYPFYLTLFISHCLGLIIPRKWSNNSQYLIIESFYLSK
jgi:hypothetical protein